MCFVCLLAAMSTTPLDSPVVHIDRNGDVRFFGNILSASPVLDKSNVKYYGAKGDGTTDDSAAFTAALAASRIVRVPAGTYLIRFSTTALSIPAGTRIVGEGKGVSVLLFRPTQTYYTTLVNIVNDNIQMEHLTVRYQRYQYGDSTFMFNFAASQKNFRLSHCEIDGGVSANGSETTCYAYAFNFSNSSSVVNTGIDIMFSDVHHTHGFLKTNTAQSTQKDMRIVGNLFYNNFSDDISINTPSGPTTNVLVSNNVLRDNLKNSVGGTALSIAFASGDDIKIIGNHISHSLSTVGIHLEENVRRFAITNNTIVTSHDGITLQSNNISGVMASPSDGTVSNNTVTRFGSPVSAANTGIWVVFDTNYTNGTPSAKRVSITNNAVTGLFAKGVAIAAREGDRVLAANNTIDGAADGLSAYGGGVNLHDNLVSNCTTGLTGNYYQCGGVSFFNCTTNVLTGSQCGVIQRVDIALPVSTLPSNSAVAFPVLSLGANDRLYGTITVRGSLEYISNNISIKSFTVSWDGTTFTKTQLASYSPGALVVDVSNASSMLNIVGFRTTSASNVFLSASFTGLYTNYGS